MDYLKKIKSIAIKTTIAIATCGIIATVTADNRVDSTEDRNSTVIEEASTDDGSAPKQYLEVLSANDLVTQTEIYSFVCNNEAETQLVIEGAAKEIAQNIITEPESEMVTASAQVNESHQVADSKYVVELTEEEYKILCTIVEAEAGDQDEKGRILVANVIINRVKSSRFPNNIKDVVFAKSGKTYQFSPTRPGGRYYKVTADETTVKCVDRALTGEDYSEGALYFTMKTSSRSWFNTSLQFLFKHGAHYFYK